jgi:hypothetical protein
MVFWSGPKGAGLAQRLPEGYRNILWDYFLSSRGFHSR